LAIVVSPSAFAMKPEATMRLQPNERTYYSVTTLLLVIIFFFTCPSVPHLHLCEIITD